MKISKVRTVYAATWDHPQTRRVILLSRRFNRSTWMELLERIGLAPESTTVSYNDTGNVRRFKGSASLKKSQIYPSKFGRAVGVPVTQFKCVSVWVYIASKSCLSHPTWSIQLRHPTQVCCQPVPVSWSRLQRLRLLASSIFGLSSTGWSSDGLKSTTHQTRGMMPRILAANFDSLIPSATNAYDLYHVQRGFSCKLLASIIHG